MSACRLIRFLHSLSPSFFPPLPSLLPSSLLFPLSFSPSFLPLFLLFLPLLSPSFPPIPFPKECPVTLFSKLGDSLAGRSEFSLLLLLFILSHAFICLFLGIKTLKEINLAFLPFESRAFTLDDPDAFEDYYSQLGRRREELYATFADQLATVCSLLGEYPSVRAWK